LFSWSDSDGYLSRAENTEPQQALGAEPEQTLQSKTPGLSLHHVRWRWASLESHSGSFKMCCFSGDFFICTFCLSSLEGS